jgi:hypothetical protein
VAFDNILKRSLLPVNNNHMHLNKCLEAYKDFVCSADRKVINSTGKNSSELLPCLSICQKAMQFCPAYFPSPDPGSCGSFKYGGRPAFICPSESDTKKPGSTYGPKDNCYTFDDT